MNREQAIERAAQAVVNWNSDSSVNSAVVMRDLRDALAMPKADAEPVEPVAWMHPDGRVVSGETMNGARKDGGAILSGLKSHNIPLYAHPPKADAERVALLERIDKDLEEAMLDEESTELLRDIRAYLGGDA